MSAKDEVPSQEELDNYVRPEGRCKCKTGKCWLCSSPCRRCGCACDGVHPAIAIRRKRGGNARRPTQNVKRKKSLQRRSKTEIRYDEGSDGDIFSQLKK